MVMYREQVFALENAKNVARYNNINEISSNNREVNLNDNNRHNDNNSRNKNNNNNYDSGNHNSQLLQETASQRPAPRRRKRKHVPHHLRPEEFVVKRNTRERSRVHGINGAFQTLRHHVPHLSHDDKASKISIIRHAAEYITHLTSLLRDADPGEVTQCEAGAYNAVNSTVTRSFLEQGTDLSCASSEFSDDSTVVSGDLGTSGNAHCRYNVDFTGTYPVTARPTDCEQSLIQPNPAQQVNNNFLQLTDSDAYSLQTVVSPEVAMVNPHQTISPHGQRFPTNQPSAFVSSFDSFVPHNGSMMSSWATCEKPSPWCLMSSQCPLQMPTNVTGDMTSLCDATQGQLHGVFS